MNGYFARMLARAQGRAAVVRAPAVTPFDTLPSLDGQDMRDTVFDPAESPSTSEQQQEAVHADASTQISPARPRVQRTAASSSNGKHASASTALGLTGDAPHDASGNARLPAQNRTTRAVVDSKRASSPVEETVAIDDFRLLRDTDRLLSSPSTGMVLATASNLARPGLHGPTSLTDDERQPFARDTGRGDASFSRQDRASPIGQRADAPTEVHVTIGRIEVSAAAAPAPAKSAQRQSPQRQPMTLDEYLAQRTRGNG